MSALIYPLPFSEVYHSLLSNLVVRSDVEVNKRTGVEVSVIPGGTSFKLDLSDGRLPVCGLRRLYPRSAAAEVAWFLGGSRDVRWLSKYAPLWDKFVEDDGITIDAAYGYRWRKHFGRDQIHHAVDALQRDSSDRRVYVSAWDPGYDGLGAEGQKNVPCPVGFTLSVVNEELHSTLMIRSSDVFVGLPYDVMGHALLMDAIGVCLDLDLGTMQVSLAHPHLYEKHYDMAGAAILQDPVTEAQELPGWGVGEIAADPDGYVKQVTDEAKLVPWPAFAPRPEVVL